MTPQKPVKNAYEQSPEAVQQWLDEEHPQIEAQAKQENAEIYWADETGLCSDCQPDRGYAERGKAPAIALDAKRSSINLISAIINRGNVRFQLYEGTRNDKRLIRFMKGLIKDAKRKAYPILNNLRAPQASRSRSGWMEMPRRSDSFTDPPIHRNSIRMKT